MRISEGTNIAVVQIDVYQPLGRGSDPLLSEHSAVTQPD